MNLLRVRRILVAIVATVAFHVTSAVAQPITLDPAQELASRAIFDGVLSPFCPGRLLRDCPSTAAHELKDKIRGMIVEGKSRAEIESYLFALYGESIRAVPPREGFGNVAWWGPGVFLGLGLAILGLWLRSKRRSGDETAPTAHTPTLTAEMAERIKRHVS